MAEWAGASESDLKEAEAELLPEGRSGLRIKGWLVESSKRPILGSLAREELEKELGVSHLPEMVFGGSALCLLHEGSGVKLHYNAVDALKGWMEEALPPVEVPAAAKWKFRSKPSQQVILDYDYTFTTPYSGSETLDTEPEKTNPEEYHRLYWQECDEQIDLTVLSKKEPILFYNENLYFTAVLNANMYHFLSNS